MKTAAQENAGDLAAYLSFGVSPRLSPLGKQIATDAVRACSQGKEDERYTLPSGNVLVASDIVDNLDLWPFVA